MEIKAFVGLVSLLVVVLGSGVETQQNETLYDEDISIVRVGRVTYPADAASARIRRVGQDSRCCRGDRGSRRSRCRH